MKGLIIYLSLLLFIGITGWLLIHQPSFKSYPTINSKKTPTRYYLNDDNQEITYDEAIDDYWSDLIKYLSESTIIDACTDIPTRCYSLVANIEDGFVTSIYFPKGGRLDFHALIEEEGKSADTDINGNSWDFYINEDDIYRAVYQWASSNNYTIVN